MIGLILGFIIISVICITLFIVSYNIYKNPPENQTLVTGIWGMMTASVMFVVFTYAFSANAYDEYKRKKYVRH